MKSVFVITALLVAQLSFAANSFTAYTKRNVLFVTVMVDTCNNFRGGIQVSDLCKDDRATRNWALTCEANVTVAGTRMACPTAAVRPYTFKVDLAKSNVAKEAQKLVLNYHGEQRIVKINK